MPQTDAAFKLLILQDDRWWTQLLLLWQDSFCFVSVEKPFLRLTIWSDIETHLRCHNTRLNVKKTFLDILGDSCLPSIFYLETKKMKLRRDVHSFDTEILGSTCSTVVWLLAVTRRAWVRILPISLLLSFILYHNLN